ncbi:hypothetical protein EYZ11_002943 [Aspergillus tanneri]|uniref:FAD dependent oxidoreductase domain-containing protein n=1 Tax=Aspergillus tanneri TaxID=1220188 RepID=A0A4S3JRM6_9EURO|nr:hypothetical protein EYZ11_002943 [Aspergillus tanneri]
MTERRVIIIGDYAVTVFDRHAYDQSQYDPDAEDVQAASVDHNKIRLALESRHAWMTADQQERAEDALFVTSGMLRVQPDDQLGALEKETLANLQRDGLRHTQFVKGDAQDRERAQQTGWAHKLLDVPIPSSNASYEAVLDSLAGLVRCNAACAATYRRAVEIGVDFVLGPHQGAIDSLVTVESTQGGKPKATGVRTADERIHNAHLVVVAAGSFSTQILPALSYHLESSAGSLATFRIDRSQTELWEKYSPEHFPVVTWKSQPRDARGRDTGSVYVLPRTPEGLVKIGYRGIKFTHFVPAPEDAFRQDGQWSVPLPVDESRILPDEAVQAIRQFVSIFLPEFADVPFHWTKLCWYTDSLDNSFVVSSMIPVSD